MQRKSQFLKKSNLHWRGTFPTLGVCQQTKLTKTLEWSKSTKCIPYDPRFGVVFGHFLEIQLLYRYWDMITNFLWPALKEWRMTELMKCRESEGGEYHFFLLNGSTYWMKLNKNFEFCFDFEMAFRNVAISHRNDFKILWWSQYKAVRESTKIVWLEHCTYCKLKMQELLISAHKNHRFWFSAISNWNINTELLRIPKIFELEIKNEYSDSKLK